MHGWCGVGVGAALVLGIAGCSGEPLPQRPSGALPPGTASVAVGSSSPNTLTAVSCQFIGGASSAVAIGTATRGVTAYLDDDRGPIATSVSITDVDGFSGSYWKGVQGEAAVTMNGSTVVISGVASGYGRDQPNSLVSKPFRVSAAC
jgi:lipoprotein LpqH